MTKIKKFEKEHYTISIASKNIALTDAIENYILEKLSKVERFTNHILEIVVTLDVQKVTHSVSIRMKFLHFMIQVRSRTENLYSAIDMATERLIKLAQKYKNKLKDKFKEKSKDDFTVSILNPISYTEEINEQIEKETLKKEEELYKIHEVISEENLPLKILTQGEAALKLELSKDLFIIYKSEEDQKKKLIYKREDKKLGLVRLE